LAATRLNSDASEEDGPRAGAAEPMEGEGAVAEADVGTGRRSRASRYEPPPPNLRVDLSLATK